MRPPGRPRGNRTARTAPLSEARAFCLWTVSRGDRLACRAGKYRPQNQPYSSVYSQWAITTTRVAAANPRASVDPMVRGGPGGPNEPNGQSGQGGRPGGGQAQGGQGQGGGGGVATTRRTRARSIPKSRSVRTPTSVYT